MHIVKALIHCYLTIRTIHDLSWILEKIRRGLDSAPFSEYFKDKGNNVSQESMRQRFAGANEKGETDFSLGW
jgi:hypothetical protein